MHVQAQFTTRVRPFVYFNLTPPYSPASLISFSHWQTLPQEQNQSNPPTSFILKTASQRAAEKALLDKSPLKTLTLEDFLESERHKLSGTLTPVTPETFAVWKRERLDKKAAEEEARRAKEATGRAMFEKGGWEGSDDEDEDEAEADGDDDSADEEDVGWDMETMRRETERIRDEKERERIEAGKGVEVDEGSGINENGDEGDGGLEAKADDI